MSVAKMEKYKENKANRKEILAKEKQKKNMTRVLTWAAAAAVVLIIAIAIGVTIRNDRAAKLAALPDYTAMNSMLVEDLAGVRETEAEEDQDHEEEAEEASETKAE